MVPENNPVNGDSEPLRSGTNGNDEEGRRGSDNADSEEPLTTQGSDEEIEEKLSGTTNLTIEQLKKKRDPGR